MEELSGLWTKKDWRKAKTLHAQTMRLLSGTIEPALTPRPNDIESKAAQDQRTEVLETLGSGHHGPGRDAARTLTDRTTRGSAAGLTQVLSSRLPVCRR